MNFTFGKSTYTNKIPVKQEQLNKKTKNIKSVEQAKTILNKQKEIQNKIKEEAKKKAEEEAKKKAEKEAEEEAKRKSEM